MIQRVCKLISISSLLTMISSVLLLSSSTAAIAQEAASAEPSLASSLVIPGVILLSVLAIIIAIGLWMKNYIKVPPNKAAIISGIKHKLPDGSYVGFRIVSGGATFKWPVLERVDYLDLGVMNIETITKSAITKQGVPLTVEAIANAKIGGDDISLRNASERFLGKTVEEIHDIVARTLEAHLRAICGTLTVEEINNDRTQFAQNMIKEAAEDLKRMGILIDIWAVQHIQDDQGYLSSLGKKRTAEVQRDAKIGEAEAKRDQDIKTAEATREATIKSSDAEREGRTAKALNDQMIAQATRDLAVKQADMMAEQAAAEARRDQAGPQAHAEAQRAVLVAQVAAQEAEVIAQTTLQERIALKNQKELEATVLKQAEAAREKLRIEAEAARKKAEIDAEAAVLQAEGQKRASVAKAEGLRDAAKAEGAGDAEKTRLIGEAEAAANRAKLLAEAEGQAAQLQKKLLAEAEGERARLLAEAEGNLKLAEALRARLLAEAEGKEKMAKAMQAMDEGARFMLLLQAAPPVIEAIGEAAAKALTPAFEAMGQGMANIDNVTIVDTGSNGNGAGGLGKFTQTVPSMFFNLMQQCKALGVDPTALLDKVGVKVLENIGGQIGSVVTPTAPAVVEQDSPSVSKKK